MIQYPKYGRLWNSKSFSLNIWPDWRKGLNLNSELNFVVAFSFRGLLLELYCEMQIFLENHQISVTKYFFRNICKYFFEKSPDICQHNIQMKVQVRWTRAGRKLPKLIRREVKLVQVWREIWNFSVHNILWDSLLLLFWGEVQEVFAAARNCSQFTAQYSWRKFRGDILGTGGRVSHQASTSQFEMAPTLFIKL